MTPAGVLFDLDNTLVCRRQSLSVYARRFHEDWAGRLHPHPVDSLDAAIREMDGGGYRPRAELFADFAARLPWREPPTPVELHQHYDRVFPHCSVSSEGLLETLEALAQRRIRIGVITNGRTAIQRRKLDQMGVLGHFNPVVISEAVGCEKPDGRIFRLALEGLELSPEETWFVGDHPLNDILGAQRAGLTPVWVRGHHPWPAAHPQPRLQIDALPELLSLLTRVP